MIQNIDCFFAHAFLIYAYMLDLIDLFHSDIFAVRIPSKALCYVFILSILSTIVVII